jgi:hypothetical protein
MFDWNKPTVQMLGRWQPWHEGHRELFKRAHATTGQVCIMVRDVGGIVGEDAGAGRTTTQDDNPFDYDEVVQRMVIDLTENGFTFNKDFIVMKVPNIVDISFGRGVGYTITEHDLGKEIHDISATKIRKQMREEGDL